MGKVEGGGIGNGLIERRRMQRKESRIVGLNGLISLVQWCISTNLGAVVLISFLYGVLMSTNVK